MAHRWRSAGSTIRHRSGHQRVVRPAVAGMSPGVAHSDYHKGHYSQTVLKTQRQTPVYVVRKNQCAARRGPDGACRAGLESALYIVAELSGSAR